MKKVVCLLLVYFGITTVTQASVSMVSNTFTGTRPVRTLSIWFDNFDSTLNTPDILTAVVADMPLASFKIDITYSDSSGVHVFTKTTVDNPFSIKATELPLGNLNISNIKVLPSYAYSGKDSRGVAVHECTELDSKQGSYVDSGKLNLKVLNAAKGMVPSALHLVFKGEQP